MRIFITGGTGFLGAPLCHALVDHELMILSRHPGRLKLPFPWHALQGDLSDSQTWIDALSAFRPEVALHLAWSNLPDYSIANNKANFEAGLELFEILLRIHCKRIVVTGTCFEYGNLTGCVAESQIPSNQGLFAAFKTAQRLIGQEMFSSADTSFIWTRPFFVYGPNQRSTSLIPSTIENLINGKHPNIRTPDAIQDFIHVDDVAALLARLATSDSQPGTYNIGSGTPTRVRDLVNLVARVLGHRELYPAYDGNGTGFWADMKKTRKAFPRFALRSLTQGIQEVVRCRIRLNNCAA